MGVGIGVGVGSATGAGAGVGVSDHGFVEGAEPPKGEVESGLEGAAGVVELSCGLAGKFISEFCAGGSCAKTSAGLVVLTNRARATLSALVFRSFICVLI